MKLSKEQWRVLDMLDRGAGLDEWCTTADGRPWRANERYGHNGRMAQARRGTLASLRRKNLVRYVAEHPESPHWYHLTDIGKAALRQHAATVARQAYGHA